MRRRLASLVPRPRGADPRSRRTAAGNLRQLPRHHRPPAHRAAAVPGAEDGSRRSADRRHRARLQQHVDGGDRQSRLTGAGAARHRTQLRSRRDGADRRAQLCGADASTARVRAPAAAAAEPSASRPDVPQRREAARPHARRAHPHRYQGRAGFVARARRSVAGRILADQSRRECPRRDDRRRHADDRDQQRHLEWRGRHSSRETSYCCR